MKILTVISNYNEQGAIAATIEDFHRNATIQSDLLVIDNSSTDQSFEIIKKAGVDYLRHPVNTGGSAGVIKTALMYAFLNGYDIYCHMDGDHQHNAGELAKIVQPILDGKADLVIGSRFITHEGFQSLPIRRLGIISFSRMMSWLAGQKISDPTSGFRAYNRRTIAFFARKYKHQIEACVQMLMIAAYAGLTIKEAAVIMNPRKTGRSEFNLKNAVKFPIFGLVSLAGSRLQKDAIKKSSHVIQP